MTHWILHPACLSAYLLNLPACPPALLIVRYIIYPVCFLSNYCLLGLASYLPALPFYGQIDWSLPLCLPIYLLTCLPVCTYLSYLPTDKLNPAFLPYLQSGVLLILFVAHLTTYLLSLASYLPALPSYGPIDRILPLVYLPSNLVTNLSACL